MAATIARAIGFNKDGYAKASEATRTGDSALAHANTERTFTTAYIRADGSGFVEVRRGLGGGVALHTFEFGKE